MDAIQSHPKYELTIEDYLTPDEIAELEEFEQRVLSAPFRIANNRLLLRYLVAEMDEPEELAA